MENGAPLAAGWRILLASQSPRRLELLRLLGLEPVVRAMDVDESFPEGWAPESVVDLLARRKAQAGLSALGQDELLIAGDTVVSLDGHILNKPADAAEAVAMLQQLSGRTHRVATAVAVATQAGGVHSEVDVCEVTFAPLDPTLIARYVASGAPLDKAGAYGIQDLLGAAAIERIHGSYYTVMGLPTHCVFRMLTAVGPRG